MVENRRLTAAGESLVRLVKRTGSGAFRVMGSLTARFRPMPDFLLIGTKRGGTTSLYYDLLKVPQIISMFPSARFLPKANETKGVHFFDSFYKRGLNWYRSYMPSIWARQRAERALGKRVVVGEASPYYLFHPLAAARAYAAAPNAKIILLLRDPVERTYSHWKERRRGNAEPLEFAEALVAEGQRLAGEEERIIAEAPDYVSYPHEQQSYVAQSRYARSLRRWADLYGMDNILVLTSEEYYADQPAAVAAVAAFLGLDAPPIKSGGHLNAAPGATMDAEVREHLRSEFAEDNAELERMIGRTLPWE
ncbi:sulfotransferase domain-containing protein [Micropruina sonneratiae]|uniref:sulfotransferase domain-containing protein n=1 Tax=Micropruina sonneratiae TaxID=2986940 RepID=UPI00222775E4|nr:sulfotransferase domain-containing protein [Micropruina sp. KQZ13P-5]MCW3158759.1 sulfotransferase domain-containing protein [Micropruina sp. KQZ13P-5]